MERKRREKPVENTRQLAAVISSGTYRFYVCRINISLRLLNTNYDCQTRGLRHETKREFDPIIIRSCARVSLRNNTSSFLTSAARTDTLCSRGLNYTSGVVYARRMVRWNQLNQKKSYEGLVSKREENMSDRRDTMRQIYLGPRGLRSLNSPPMRGYDR